MYAFSGLGESDREFRLTKLHLSAVPPLVFNILLDLPTINDKTSLPQKGIV